MANCAMCGKSISWWTLGKVQDPAEGLEFCERQCLETYLQQRVYEDAKAQLQGLDAMRESFQAEEETVRQAEEERLTREAERVRQELSELESGLADRPQAEDVAGTSS